MRDGHCPKCGGVDVRVLNNIYGDRRAILPSVTQALSIVELVCMGCLYVESYVSDADAPRLAEIAERQHWPRLDAA